MRIELETAEEIEKVLCLVEKKAVVFYQPDCFFCRSMFKRLEESYCSFKYYSINCDNNKDFLQKSVVLRLFYPFTRVYANGECVYEKSGELYHSQIMELLQYINT
jgi:hypothetical protein